MGERRRDRESSSYFTRNLSIVKGRDNYKESGRRGKLKRIREERKG